MAKRERIPIDTEIRDAHESLVSIFHDFGVDLDYSIESLHRIENYLEENYPSNQDAKNPFPAVRVGVKIFYIGAYLGETLRKKLGGNWQFDEHDPLGQIRAELCFENGERIRPIEDVMTRIEEKLPIEIFSYAKELVAKYANSKS